MTRKRSSVRDMLLGGVFHSEGNASTPAGGTNTDARKGVHNVTRWGVVDAFGLIAGGAQLRFLKEHEVNVIVNNESGNLRSFFRCQQIRH